MALTFKKPKKIEHKTSFTLWVGTSVVDKLFKKAAKKKMEGRELAIKILTDYADRE